MRKSWLLAKREIRERIGSRSFLFMSVFGPLIILPLGYLLFTYGGEGKQHWKVLIADPTGIMENKILAKEDGMLTYAFADGYIEMEEFRDAQQFKSFDAMVEINEKVLSNKTAFVFFREKPSVRMQTHLQFQVERRIEEVMIKRFTKLSVRDFRKIKQPLNVAFRNVYDPMDEASDMRAWAGFFFGCIIFVFIFLFGMTVLRSIATEKTNRIVEVLLASVNPRQLLSGKIIGIGLSAFVQFAIWIGVIGLGMYMMRLYVFPDLFDASNFEMLQEESSSGSMLEYNEYLSLVFERLQFGNLLFFFTVFFIGGYLFYAAFFSAIGASSGSESDGQQFVIPILLLLGSSVFAGYYTILNPESQLTTWFHYLPFTSPVTVMVRLTQGYGLGEGYQIWLSLFILLASALSMLIIAGRIYKNGILQFGHRLRLSLLFNWFKQS
jgi:ABC-2 type transport system permease protein